MGMVLNLIRLNKKKFKKIEKDPEVLEDLLESEGNFDLYIDKSWEGIHYLLTGKTMNDKVDESSILEKVILGGGILGGEENAEEFDFGYGPPTYLSVEEVKTIADVLATTELNEFEKRFIPANFIALSIYPHNENSTIEDVVSYFDYYNSYLKDVASFFQVAAQKEEMIIKVLN
jgi:Domain of unknown function (DUF1877)